MGSDPSHCLVAVFPPFGTSDHVVLSFSIDFSLNSKEGEHALYHRKAFRCFCTKKNDFYGGIFLVWVLLVLFPLFYEGIQIEIDSFFHY